MNLVGNIPPGECRPITLFGEDLELRNPTFKSIMNARDTENSAERGATMIINYCYVPGTNDLAFEAADLEMILRWPFTPDLMNLNNAIAEMTGINIGEAEEDLKKDPLDEQS